MTTLRCIENNPTHPDAALLRDYADLGVSTGYLGGVGVYGDDRSFRIFVRLASRQYQEMSDLSVCVFDVPRSEARTWKYDVDAVRYDTPANRAKLDAYRQRLAEGKIFLTVDMLRKQAQEA